MHVATTRRVYGERVYESVLLRRTYREGGKVKHQTLGNLSHLPKDLIAVIRQRLRGEPVTLREGLEIVRSLPHGSVRAILGSLRNLGMEEVVGSRRSRERDMVVAMIVARVMTADSKLATARGLEEETATSSLAEELELEEVEEKEVYEALDWLGKRQWMIEAKLAERHLREGTLVLYDVSSSYYTGRRSELVAYGHDRDGRKGFAQIVYGLVCNGEGCPVAIEVFAGNTADSQTLMGQVKKIRERFGVKRVVLVGDRGMITSRQIEEDLREREGLDWITALRSESLKKLAREGVLQPSLFDERDLAEVRSPDYPGERLILCRNPYLAEERETRREELIQATEKKLDGIVAATQRKGRPLRGKDKVGLRVGRVVNQYRVAKHFKLQITEEGFTYCRDEARIAEEKALDGLYVLRTSVTGDAFSTEGVVRAYKDLSKVERAFRSLKTVDLKIRPIYHWLPRRIRAHVFLCMLAYYVEWHMRQKLAPLLFDDHDKESADALRASIVAPAQRSEEACHKDNAKRTGDGYPVHSFRTLLLDLATLTKNRVRVPGSPEAEFDLTTRPTVLQQRAFDLLEVVL